MVKLKKYEQFILEKHRPVMKYSAFDWDDNILFMPTVIHMEQLVNDEWVPKDVSTDEFAKVRTSDNWRPIQDEEGNWLAFYEFRDFGPRGNQAFIEDMKVAIQNKSFGPSWDAFIHCLTQGSIFAIITARGHEPDTLRAGVEWIIYNYLTDEQRTEMGANLTAFMDMFLPNYDIMRESSLQTMVSAYLDKCDFVGVSASSFADKFPGIDPTNPEEAKGAALTEFVDRIKRYGEMAGGDVEVGFSDDDLKTLDFVNKHFNELNKVYDDIIFHLYDTSDPSIKGGVKRNIE